MTLHPIPAQGSSVVAVSSAADHTFSKPVRTQIVLLAGLGVAGDAHAGVTVQHRSRVAKDPGQPNLRQVHLLSSELLDQLGVEPGALGENVTTHGIDLLGLSVGTLLHLGEEAVVEVTGLRNPCVQIEHHRTGLLTQVVGRAPDGAIERKAGVMSVVRHGGTVSPGDAVRIELPAVHVPMHVV